MRIREYTGIGKARSEMPIKALTGRSTVKGGQKLNKRVQWLCKTIAAEQKVDAVPRPMQALGTDVQVKKGLPPRNHCEGEPLASRRQHPILASTLIFS